MPSLSPTSIEALRQRIATPLEVCGGVLPFGDGRIDRHLPGGGLPLGQLHEIGADGIEAQTGAIVGGFAAALGARLLHHDRNQRVLLWITSCCDLYAPGLLPYGIDPGRLIVVHTGNDAQTLDAMETALRSGAAAAVLGEAGTLPRLAARRLQLACLHAQTTGLLLRRWRYGCKAPAEPAAAVTRWRVGYVRASDKISRGLWPSRKPPGLPHWQIELRHARGGRAGAWIMELGNAANALRVVAVLGDDQVAPRLQRAVG